MGLEQAQQNQHQDKQIFALGQGKKFLQWRPKFPDFRYGFGSSSRTNLYGPGSFNTDNLKGYSFKRPLNGNGLLSSGGFSGHGLSATKFLNFKAGLSLIGGNNSGSFGSSSTVSKLDRKSQGSHEGTLIKEGTPYGFVNRWNLKGILGKVKPKTAISFASGKIYSSLNPFDQGMKRNLGSCSLQALSDPDSIGSEHNNEPHPSQYNNYNMGCSGWPNIDEKSRWVEDFEVDSDGETLRSNEPISISSDDGVETDSQQTGDLESQKDNQMAVLEDIRDLFSEDQEPPVNSVQVFIPNSDFTCERDISIPQPIIVIHPSNLDLKTGESGKWKMRVKEGETGVLVEEGLYADKVHQIKGHDTDWEDIVTLVESMGFSLVPSENLTFDDGKSISGKIKRGKRELQNLRFDVNFKNTEFKRATFNSK